MNKLMFLVGLSAVVLVGCSNDENQFAEVDALPFVDFTEIDSRLAKIEKGAPKKLSELAPEEVVVAVNGYPLTRQAYDDRLVIETKALMDRHGKSHMMIEQKVNERREKIVQEFVNMRLLIDEARNMKVLDPTNVCRAARRMVMAKAIEKGNSLAQFEKTFPVDKKYLYYDIAQRLWVDALIATNIPPVVKVDDGFANAVSSQIAADNMAIRNVNAEKAKRLKGVKAEIEGGKRTFADAVKAVSEAEDVQDAPDGFWGEWERGQMQDRKLQAKLFALPAKGLSEPIEDEEGVHLVKVLKIKPAETNAKGRVIQKEIRSFAHIMLKKEPEIIVLDREGLLRDLKRQMQLQAVNAYVGNLKTNGTHKIVFPHGNNLF